MSEPRTESLRPPSSETLIRQAVSSALEILKLNSPNGRTPFRGDIFATPAVASYLVRQGYDPVHHIRQAIRQDKTGWNPSTDIIILDPYQDDITTEHQRYLHLRYTHL